MPTHPPGAPATKNPEKSSFASGEKPVAAATAYRHSLHWNNSNRENAYCIKGF
jgi:hypothetical protein